MKTVYRQLMTSFCRSIVWIDDEILSHQDFANAPITNERQQKYIKNHFELFQRQAESFLSIGIPCSLIPFKTDRSNSKMSSLVAKEYSLLCSKADIIIIDWELSLNDNGEYCAAILQEICSLKGLRIIVIYSQNAEQASDSLSYLFPKISESIDADDWCTDENGKFVKIITKVESANLADKIISSILRIPQSQLAWAAFELSNNIRNALPSILNNLPENPDLGLLIDYLLSGRSDFTANTIAENLLEDLKFQISPMRLSVMDSNFLQPDKWDTARDLVVTLKSLTQAYKASHPSEEKFGLGEILSLISTFPDDIDFKEYVDNIKPAILDFCAYANSNSKIADLATLKSSILQYSSFCENIGIGNPLHCADEIRRGNIYKFKGNNKYRFICISQACDAKNSKTYYFLKCLKSREGKPFKKFMIFFNFNSQLYFTVLNPEYLIVVKKYPTRNETTFPKDDITSYEFCGALRSETIDRLSNSFWNHITRVGVNLPCIDRAIRS